MTKSKSESKEVTSWQDQMAESAKEIAKTEQPSANRIYFTSGVMTYMEQPLVDNQLDCIILAHCAEHVFYRDKYSPGQVKPPECFALGKSGDPLYPHEKVLHPIHNECDTCPYFKFGSDLEGGRGKACAEKRRLSAVAYQTDGNLAEADMASMSIPVMSVRNWANYVNKLAATLQRPPWGVVTRVKLVPDKKSQFRVIFDTVKALSDDEIGQIHGRIPTATASLMQPYEMNPPEEQEQAESKNTKF